jgi:transcriptional regulator with XRE-family HTH domain
MLLGICSDDRARRRAGVRDVAFRTGASSELMVLVSYPFSPPNCSMTIGERIRAIRAEKGLSQGDIEERSGLLRCYISRVEHGHTVPAVETVEKIAKALECPLYQIFYEAEGAPKVPHVFRTESRESANWGLTGKAARYFDQLRRSLGRAQESDRKLILAIAQRMVSRKRKRPAYTGRRKRLLPFTT